MTNQEKSLPQNDALFKGIGVEVDIKKPDNFLKIKETLTRIGVASKKDKKLFQSCHILHKRNSEGLSKYSIVHFKEMFQLDGKDAKFDEQDIPRRNAIVRLLEEWDLLDIVDQESAQDVAAIQTIKILSFKEKSEWELIAKYKIGKKKREDGNE